MGGLEILLLLIGAVVGAGLMFWWQEDRIAQLKIEHKRALRKVIETTERQSFASRGSNTADRLTSPPIEDKGLSPTIMQAATDSAIAPPQQFISAPRSPETPSAPVINEPIIEMTIDEQIIKETTIDPQIIEETTIDAAPISDELSIDEPATAPPLPLPTQIQAAPPLVTQIFAEPPLTPDRLVASTQQLAAIPTQTFRRPLKDKITAWGQIASPSYIPQLLQYVNHPSPNVREDVAKALGQIAATHNLHAYEPKVIPALEQLSRDRHLDIRYQAIVALGQLKSARSIPILTAALHDPSSKLVKTASSALEQLKYYALPPTPQPLRSRKRVIYKKPIRWL